MGRVDYCDRNGGAGGVGGVGALAPHFSRRNSFLVLVWGTYEE